MASTRTTDRTTTTAAAERRRPRTDYWDFRSASWQAVSPIPVPRRGE